MILLFDDNHDKVIGCLPFADSNSTEYNKIKQDIFCYEVSKHSYNECYSRLTPLRLNNTIRRFFGMIQYREK